MGLEPGVAVAPCRRGTDNREPVCDRSKELHKVDCRTTGTDVKAPKYG